MTVTAPPRPPHQDQMEALIEEARERARKRRRRYGAAVVLVLLAGAGLYTIVARGAGTATVSHGRAPIDALSAPQTFHAGQFWYTRTVTTWRVSRPAGGEYQAKVFMRSRGPMVLFDVRVSTETWVGTDGTMRQRTLVLSQRFASPTGRAQWNSYHRPLPNFARDIDSDSITQGDAMFPASEPSGDPIGPQDLGDGAFTYRQLLSLPTQPAALRARIEHAFAALERRRANSALNPCGWGKVTGCPTGPPVPAWQRKDSRASADMGYVAEMLSWPVPERLRLALFHAATALRAVSSHVTVDRRARDSLGRPGVAVTTSPPRYPGHYDPIRLIFDRATGALLAQPGFGAQGIVTAQGVTNSIRKLPRDASPLRVSAAPPEPPTVSISPTVGGPNTVFKVALTASPRVGASAPRLGGGVSGPVYRGCASGFNRPTPPAPPRGSRSPAAPRRTRAYPCTPTGSNRPPAPATPGAPAATSSK